MARYTPEFLAAARHGYEDTDQPMTALAADFGIGITTLQTLVRKNGWSPRSQRLRECPPSVRLLEETEALVAALPERPTEAQQVSPSHEATPPRPRLCRRRSPRPLCLPSSASKR